MLQVVDTDPSPTCIIDCKTILITGRQVVRSADEKRMIQFGYDDLGGVRKQLAQIKEMVELPLRYPQLFKSIGIKVMFI